MTPEDAFIADILEHPDDDAPRLILADWLEDRGGPGDADRAEFIRIQCRRAHPATKAAEERELRSRAEHLLKQHWHNWVRPLAHLLGTSHSEPWLTGEYQPEALYKFRRGFIYVLEMPARRFIEHALEILWWAPLRQIRLHSAGSVAGELATGPFLRGLERIEFTDYFSQPLDGPGLTALARSPWLGSLRGLGLYRNDVADSGLIALAEAAWLPGLTVLELGENGISAKGITALARTALSFRPVRLLLDANPIGDEGVAALVSSPIVSRLTTLSLSRCNLGPEAASALAASPWLASLRYLHLENNQIEDAGARAPAQAPWVRRLAGLHISNCSLSEQGSRALQAVLPK